MINKGTILLAIGGIFIIGISGMLKIINYTNVLPTDGYSVKKDSIVVRENKLEMDGVLFNSSKYFKEFKYTIEKESLYIMVYAKQIIIPDKSKKGDFHLTINEDTSKINYIYLKGKDKKDTKLVWQRK